MKKKAKDHFSIDKALLTQIFLSFGAKRRSREIEREEEKAKIKKRNHSTAQQRNDGNAQSVRIKKTKQKRNKFHKANVSTNNIKAQDK